MEYRADDRELQAAVFVEFVNQVWPGNYDMERTRDALSKTINIIFFRITYDCRLFSHPFFS